MAFIPNSGEDDAATQNVATNLFNQTTGGGQPVQSGAASPTGQGGDQSQSIQGGPQNATQKAPSISNSASSSKEVIRRNEGKAQSPYDLGEMSANINNARTSLQNEANNYVDTQKKTDYSVPSDQINKALSGDSDAYNSLGQRLTQAKPVQAAFNQTTTTDFSPKVNQLEDSSLKNYFKTSGGPMATQGDAAFDTMLLNKNKDFKLQRDAVKNEATGLNADAKSIKDKAAADASAGYDQAYNTGTQKIKDTIRGDIDPIRTTAEQKAAAAEAARQKYAGLSAQDQLSEKNTPGYADWLHSIVSQIGAAPAQIPYLNEMIDQGLGRAQTDTNEMSLAGRIGVNPALNFINTSQAPVTANSYLTPEQASMITSGNRLLGQGGQMYTGGGTAGNPYSFNKDAASAYLRNLIGQKKSDDEATLQGVKEANQRADAVTSASGSKILEELKDRFPSIGGSDRHDENYMDPTILTASNDDPRFRGIPKDQIDYIKGQAKQLIAIKKRQDDVKNGAI